MDRRSWLWRRKSSDKSPGETESSGSGSGSMSSPSDRFSGEQQAYSNQNIQSPDIMSKAMPHCEDVNDSVKILTEKLSAALANITAKEALVQQHAKVAEEAVTGWEKAENEVITLKQQLDVATKKNSSLEDKVVHLDGALKECLRQLRQVKEEQGKMIQEVIIKESLGTEFKRSELEDQLSDLRAQLQIVTSSESNLRLRLESTEKEIASLRFELRSKSEELKVTALERDLSTKTAETASKQHLESIKKVSKLEAECRRLKAMIRKANSINEQNSVEYGAQVKVQNPPSKNTMPPSPEISIMDDFLEMEKLAALPARENRNFSSASSEKQDGSEEFSLKSELESMKKRTDELEKKLEKLEAEKVELSLTLTRSQDQLKLSDARFAQLQAQYNECQNQFKLSQAQLSDGSKKLNMLQAELELANELRQAIELELEDANIRKEKAESQLKVIVDERKIMLSKSSSQETETERERSMYAEASSKCRAMEDELSRMKHEVESLENRLTSTNDAKEVVERDLRATILKKETAESQLKTTQTEVKSLLAKVRTLENEAKKERCLSVEFATKCRKLEDELSKTKHETETCRNILSSVKKSKEAIELELKTANAKRQESESQLRAVEVEAKSLLAKVGSLENEAKKERNSSMEFAVKCRELENELFKLKCEAGIRFEPLSKEELNVHQEKELAVAAGKLADCQKTIASLGMQLKSLATLDDLMLDSEKLIEISGKN